MRNPSITIDIDAPPERVWAVVSDVERWSEWTPSVTSIKKIDQGPLVVGSRVKIRQPKLPPAVWEVTEICGGRSFTWKSGGLGVTVLATHSVEPKVQGSRATLALQFEGLLGGIVARLTRGINERYLRYEADGLKQRSTQI